MSLRIDGRAQRGEVVLDVQLDAADGETVAVMGPNGAGKTSLLRLVAGLDRLSHGRIEIDGTTVDDGAVVRPARERGVGYVPQGGMVFGHLTVRDNIAFSPRSSADRRETLLDELGLTDLADERAGSLSGGQQQRVALARALSADPRVLLLDEPSAALDVGSRVTIHRTLRARRDLTTVVVTHDPVEAAALAERLVILEGGRIAQQGTTAQVRQRPATAYAASLNGLNLVGATAEGRRATTDDGIELVLAEPASGSVHIVVPPRAVALHLEPPAGSPRNVWRSTVLHLDRQHDIVRVELGAPLPVTATVTESAARQLGLQPGGPVWASVKATELVAHPRDQPR